MTTILFYFQFDSVTFTDGSPYEPTTLWKDLFAAIKDAQKFIYITGWSVYTEILLVRDGDDPDGESNVGELLKRKADEGVRVLLMVWNEKLSTEGSPGLMGTHDEETRLYFQGSAVECVLVSRMKREGMLASNFVGTCYTHHQKTVISIVLLTRVGNLSYHHCYSECRCRLRRHRCWTRHRQIAIPYW